MTLSLGVKKVESLLQSDRALAKKVERMERNMKKRSRRKYFITIAQTPLPLIPISFGFRPRYVGSPTLNPEGPIFLNY
jgi:hypothetical protein